ncbi:unnamed protein product [Caenorhabditis brenneri]
MVHPAQGRAVALLIAFIIWGLYLGIRLQILLPADMFIIAREVYRMTRTSGVLKYKKVRDIIYWRDPETAGIFFASLSIALHIICNYSIITIITCTLLFTTGSAAAYRIYQKKMKGITNTKDILSEFIEKYLLPSDSFIERAICLYKSFLKLVLLNNGNQTIRLIIFLHALKDTVHAFVEFPLIMMVAFFGASIIPKIYKDNQKTIDPLLARYSENIEKFKKWHDARFPPRIQVDAEEKKDE